MVIGNLAHQEATFDQDIQVFSDVLLEDLNGNLVLFHGLLEVPKDRVDLGDFHASVGTTHSITSL